MPDQAGPAGRPGRAASADGPIVAGTPADAGRARPPTSPPALGNGLRAEIDAIVAGASHDPHAVLGAHPGPDGVTVRALRPLAEAVTVVLPDGRRFPASHVHEGVFAATLPVTEVPDYRIAVTYPGSPGPGGAEAVTDDPYRHLPTLGEMDLYLIGEGRHEQLWQVLGAHVRTYGEVTGTSFAVWAPNARGVRVIGDFNHWDGRGHPMRSLGGAGVWELFVPEVADGTTVQVRDPRAGRAAGGARPTRWPVSPSSRPRRRRWCSRPGTSGGTGTGWTGGPRASPRASRPACTRCTSAPGGPACPTWSWPRN